MNAINETIVIRPEDTLLSSLSKMDAGDVKALVVVKDGKFVSILSIGDVQRAILANTPMESSVAQALRKKVLVASPDESAEDVKQKMLQHRIECMPVVDDDNIIHGIYTWEDFFGEQLADSARQIDAPAVIMAGGIGSRLRPLTNVIPKPLVPIGEKPIIESIIQRFRNCGVNRFYATLGYKPKMIEAYFEDLPDKDYEIDFVTENKPLGTAGSLKLLEEHLNDSFFVSNCDIVINQRVCDIYDCHKRKECDITLVYAVLYQKLAYGTVETGENGNVITLHEKPESHHKVNTGFYVLEPHVLDIIPDGEMYHMTHLIEEVLKNGGKVGAFPIIKSDWLDIGQAEDYLSLLSRLGEQE